MSGSAFPGTRFEGCQLQKADLRLATDYALAPRENQVRGARFALPDVVGLLSGFGIDPG